MEEKAMDSQETLEKDTARYSIRFNLEDDRQYQAARWIEQEHHNEGKTYTDIFVEAMEYWMQLFKCDEYPGNINLVAMYFEELKELEINTRKKRIHNPDYEPEISEKEILEKYLSEIRTMPKMQFLE